MYLARQHTGMSFPEIGRAVGHKNHSTVIAACQRVETLSNSGQLVCWTMGQEVRHQAMPEVLEPWKGQLRKGAVREIPDENPIKRIMSNTN